MRKRFTIIYKNGTKIHAKAKDFNITRKGSEITTVNWDKMIPNPVFLNVDEILAVYDGWV